MSIWRSRAREVLLTAGAVLGSLCLLMVAAGLVLDVRPLVFRSGSMAPAIETGDLAIARTVDATELVAGDVVSVSTESGQRVTHRVVASGDVEGGTALMLRGDANDAIDAETYVVESADKVLVTLPKAGYAVGALQSTGGALVLGGLLVVLFTIVVRGDRSVPPGGSGGGTRRRAVKPGKGRRVARRAAIATFGSTLIVAPAMAAPWTDDVAVTGPSFSAVTPTAPTLNCTGVGVFSVTFSWNQVPGATGYTLYYDNGNSTIDRAADQTSATITGVASGNRTAYLVARFGASTWVSTPSNTRVYRFLVLSTCG